MIKTLHMTKSKVLLTGLWIVYLFFSGLADLKAAPANAEIHARLGAIEETDDVLKPAVGAEFVVRDQFGLNLMYWGRSFGPVSETRYLISGYYSFVPIKPAKILRASVGLSILNEKTALEYGSSNIQYDRTDTEWNAGAFFGLDVSLYSDEDAKLKIFWESSVFPAGQAIILLVTGRKQTIGMSVGMML